MCFSLDPSGSNVGVSASLDSNAPCRNTEMNFISLQLHQCSCAEVAAYVCRSLHRLSLSLLQSARRVERKQLIEHQSLL